jgi:hypothetical protein
MAGALRFVNADANRAAKCSREHDGHGETDGHAGATGTREVFASMLDGRVAERTRRGRSFGMCGTCKVPIAGQFGRM